MGAIKLDSEQFNSTYAAINKASNTSVIDTMRDLAAVLKQQEGSSTIVDQALNNCKQLADSYNGGFYESLVSFKKTFDELFDLSEYMDKKANIGDVSRTDSSFQAGTLDASKVMV